MRFQTLFLNFLFILLPLVANAQTVVTSCPETMDVGAFVKIEAVREDANIRLNVETPSCSNLKILGIWKALELTQGKRELTGKFRGLSGSYEKGEKSLIGLNLAEQNPFLEPGDADAMKGLLLIKGIFTMEYQWIQGMQADASTKASSKAGAGSARKTKGKKPKATPTPAPTPPVTTRINLPISIQVQPAK